MTDAPEEVIVEGDFGEFDTAPVAVDDDWEPPPKRSLLPLLIVLGGGALVGGGAGLGAGLLANMLLAPAEVQEVEPEELLVTQDLDVVNVNLRGDGGNRILSVRAQVDVRTLDAEALHARVPVLRDSLLLLASDHTAEELLQGRGRARFRSELAERFDLLLDNDRVSTVYLTELVVK